MKRHYGVIIIALIIVFLMPVAAIAEDEANKYNYSTAQGGKTLDVKPGASSTGYIDIYNVDGNRITHVIFNETTVPDGWTVAFDPPVHGTTLSIGGETLTVQENLNVPPTEVQAEEILNPPTGYVNLDLPNKITIATGLVTGADSATVLTDSAATFITDGVEVGDRVFNLTDGSSALIASIDSQTQLTLVETLIDGVPTGGGLLDGTDNIFQAHEADAEVDSDEYRVARIGYALAKRLKIVITVPASAQIGSKDTVSVHSVASWLGQGGTGTITQERDFSYAVSITRTGSEEVIIGDPFDWSRWQPVIIAGGIGVVVLGIVYVPRIIAKRKKPV